MTEYQIYMAGLYCLLAASVIMMMVSMFDDKTGTDA